MTEEHLKPLLKMGKKHWPEDGWLTMSYLKNSLGQKGLSYAALENDRVIGGVIMVFEDIVKNWIRYIIIEENYRNSGTGSRLLEKITKHLKHGESIFVDAGAGLEDRGAVHFYEKNGFKNRGKVKSLYGKHAGYILEKDII